jgi:hypothetical protein
LGIKVFELLFTGRENWKQPFAKPAWSLQRGGLPIEQIMNNRKQKSLREIEGIIIMDGLVSTGKRISQHNIKYNFYYPKNIYHKFYSHFKPDCG